MPGAASKLADTPRTRSSASHGAASMSGTEGGRDAGKMGDADAITNIFSPLSSVALAQIAKEAKAKAEEPPTPQKFTPHRITSAQILLMLKNKSDGGGGGEGGSSADSDDGGIPPPPTGGFGPPPGAESASASGMDSAMPPPMPVRSSSRREPAYPDPARKTKQPRKERQSAPTTGDDPGCNCKKSRCLKLYCQCFAQDALCKDLCKCVSCLNTEATLLERDDARKSILSRNPAAFATKINDDGKGIHKLGCKCRKSACLKKYCECFHAGVYCGPNCSCVGCKNMGPGGAPRDQGATDSAAAVAGPSGRGKGGSKRRAIATAAAAAPEKRSPNDNASLQAAEDLFCMKTGSPRKEAAARKAAALAAAKAAEEEGESLGSKQPKDGFFANAVSLNFTEKLGAPAGLGGMTVMVEASTIEHGSFRDSGRGSAKRPRSAMEGEGDAATQTMGPPPPPPTHPPPPLEPPPHAGAGDSDDGSDAHRAGSSRNRGFRVVPRVGGEVVDRSENENGLNKLGGGAEATHAKGRKHTRAVSMPAADFLQCTESIEAQSGGAGGDLLDGEYTGAHSDGDGEGVEGVSPALSAGSAVADDSSSPHGGSSAGTPLTLPSEPSPNTTSSPASPGGGGDASSYDEGGESRKRRREGSIDQSGNDSPKTMLKGMRVAHGMVGRDQPATLPVRV